MQVDCQLQTPVHSASNRRCQPLLAEQALCIGIAHYDDSCHAVLYHSQADLLACMLCSSLQHAAAWKHLASLSEIMNQSLVSVTEHRSAAACLHDLRSDAACKEGEAELRSGPCAPCAPPYGAIIRHTANHTAHTAPYGPYAYGSMIIKRFHTEFEGPNHRPSPSHALWTSFAEKLSS